jgi:GNAT superfamily N-acetyltransferase
MATPNILQARVVDAAAVGRLVNQLLCELAPDHYGPENATGCEATALSLLGSDRIWAFLAWDGENPVGVLTLHQCHAIYAQGAFGEISELYVEPDYRSHQVGDLLVKAAVEFSRAQGWDCLEVGAPDLPRWQRSVDFYKRQGFTEIGPRLELKT